MIDMIEIVKWVLGFLDLINFNDDCIVIDIIKLMVWMVIEYGVVVVVCVWLKFVVQVVDEFVGIGVKVVIVVNFLGGGEDMEVVFVEICQVIVDGVDEIDLVMLYKVFVEGCKGFVEEQIIWVKVVILVFVIFKVILEIGEIKDLLFIYVVFNVVIVVGVDFIKMLIGKVVVNVILEVVEIMLIVIEEVCCDNGEWVIGFKLVGGIWISEDVVVYLVFVDKIMGYNWVFVFIF